jgi:hypothetical protein
LVNNVEYTVQSQVDWVRDSTGGTQSCNNSATQADYMRITSTTSSNLVNTPIAPITQSSLVAPPVGAFGANQGSLGIQVNGRDGTGMEDVMVKIAGPTTISNPTNSAGCAIFAYVPVGAYTASVDTVGWVDKGGNQKTSVGATVSNGTVNVKNLDYDQAASVDGIFDTETLGGATVPATTTQLSAANPGVPSGPFAPFAGERVWDPTGAAVGTISATGLYPFKDGYNLYGGGCPGADPTKNDPDYFTTAGAGAVVAVDPATASPAVKVRIPSINLRVLYNGAPLLATYQLTTRIVATQTSAGCTTNPEKFTFAAPSTDVNGWMLQPALPFGSYSVCVQSLVPGSGSTTKKKSVTVNNYFHRGIKPSADPSAPVSPVVDLNSGTVNGTC